MAQMGTAEFAAAEMEGDADLINLATGQALEVG